MTLADSCRTVATVAQDAAGWVADGANAKTVGPERSALLRDFRRTGARARKLAVAAERPMCVGVFGPSQAGKSFLVSVLARPQNGRLIAALDGHALDFIREVNPEGEGESTGLVTRFTVRPVETPKGFPVCLRLLTEADIARILANTFLMDGDLSEPPPNRAEITQLFERYRGRRAPEPTGGLTEDEVWEIQEYFEKGFARVGYVQSLRAFWDEAAQIAPRLEPGDRAEFLSLLWGRHDEFTQLYRRLTEALRQLGRAPIVHAAIAALVPREQSIIDVKLLAGLDGEDGGDPVLLKAGAIETELPRPIVTALTAELVIPMAETPWPMFEHTDLLDFPGARARFEYNIDQVFADADTPLKDTFLRGKVAYLFDRYVAEQELTSMLLCIPPSNMEVTNLPALVEDWVAATHGATAEERARTQNILFFVLTKFDMHLVDSAGSGDDAATRFQRRMEASLLDPFGKLSESWPNRWTPSQPFRNSFWLRNPNYPAEAVIRYDGPREIEVLDHKRARLDELKAGCLAAPAVQRHFAEPEAAWEAAMRLNDGGIAWLVQHLTPVCRPEIKERQVAQALERLRGHLLQSLAPFHVPDDLDARLKARQQVAERVVQGLDRSFEARRFALLLEGLAVDATEIADRAARVPDTIRIAAPGAPTERPRAARVRPTAAGAVTAATAPDGPRSMTREAYQAETALTVWTEGMHALAGRDDLEAQYAIEPWAVSELVSELAAGARRLGLEGEIAEAIAEWPFASAEGQLGPAAMIASERINRFVARLGADRLPPAERPTVPTDDGPRSVFPAAPLRFTALDLPAEPSRADEALLTDYLFALFRLFEDNAKSADGKLVNADQNAALGRLLEELRAA